MYIKKFILAQEIGVRDYEKLFVVATTTTILIRRHTSSKILTRAAKKDPSYQKNCDHSHHHQALLLVDSCLIHTGSKLDTQLMRMRMIDNVYGRGYETV